MTVPEQMAVQVTNIVPQQNATVHALEKLLLALPQAELPLDHFFSDGIYARKLTMPVSAILTGATHKQNHLAILLKGQVAINSRQGTAVFNAPYVVNELSLRSLRQNGLLSTLLTRLTWNYYEHKS
jgi:hypothetical protein